MVTKKIFSIVDVICQKTPRKNEFPMVTKKIFSIVDVNMSKNTEDK